VRKEAEPQPKFDSTSDTETYREVRREFFVMEWVSTSLIAQQAQPIFYIPPIYDMFTPKEG